MTLYEKYSHSFKVWRREFEPEVARSLPAGREKTTIINKVERRGEDTARKKRGTEGKKL